MANACQSMILESRTELNLLFDILDLGVDLYPMHPLATPYLLLSSCPGVPLTIIIIIIIIERKDLGSVMSKDCKDTLHFF